MSETEPLKVVIIEDEKSHFFLMKRAILKEFPLAEVHHFDEAGACLEQLDRVLPDVIIADYLMPGMNGIEFLDILRRQNQDIPVIMTTGQGDEKIAVHAMKLGASDYLVKSSDFFSLLPSTIEKVVRERRLKDSLCEVEKRFRDLAESTSDWIWEVDINGRYLYSNPVVERILGYRPEEVIGRYFYDFFTEERKEIQRRAAFELMVEGKPISAFVNHLVRKDGREVIMETSGVPIFDKSGKLRGYRGIDRDITERKHAEEHIHSLTQQLMRMQENERQRISRGLHDLIGQDLSSLKIGLDTLFDGHPDVAPEIRQKVSALSGMFQGTIMAIRDLAYALRPPTLDHLGLIQTVQEQCEEFSARYGIRVDFFTAGMSDLKLDFDTQIILYRLIQEGLSNIRKYAEATLVTISLVASFPNVILRIEDNGKGFDVQSRMTSALKEKRMGLRSMEERVALLQGKMRIDSRPMQGTRIRIEFPYREGKSE